MTHSAVDNLVRVYGLPNRWPTHVRKNKPSPIQVAASMIPKPPTIQYDTRTVWRVTVTRTLVEEVIGESLLDVAAHYDGSDAKIIKAERV